jgi:hypothetical protein
VSTLQKALIAAAAGVVAGLIAWDFWQSRTTPTRSR